MGLFTLAGAGCGLILIGLFTSLIPKKQSDSSKITLFSTLTLSLLFIFNSLFSLFDAKTHSDQVGSALQLQLLSIELLFLVYSILGLLKFHTKSLPLPLCYLRLVSLFAFVEEFMLFYMQKKDPKGIENRYYDLMLLPVGICIVSTVFGFSRVGDGVDVERLGVGVGLVMQGMWFVQMGFSFFSTWIVDGCFLDQRSRGNYTVRCKGEMAYHRGRGIATLQFNCHLAFFVVLVVGVYGLIATRDGSGGEFRDYRRIGGEMRNLSSQEGQFALGSDEDDEIEVVESGVEMKGAVVEMGSNGFGSHQ